MTKRGAPTPPPPPPSDGEYARKLALAILSTLQTKGLLSAGDVDAILIAARRSAQGQAAPAATPPAPHSAAVPMQVSVQPAPPPGNLSWHTTRPPEPASPQATSPRPQEKEKTPPVIDMKLD